MSALTLLLAIATSVPLADAPATLDAFAHECAAAPAERRFDESTFARALARLNEAGKYHARAWAMTCDKAVLCQRRPSNGKCPAIYGQAPPWGATYRAGELLILVDDPNGGGSTAIYAVPASEGRLWTAGYPIPGGAVSAIDGPAFE
jgi:hypothetical protein